jgi:hypothetical protein
VHEVFVAVLIPRVRTIGVRLSEDEFSSLEKFCAESGARSISDLARSAICSFVNGGNPRDALAATVRRNAAEVKRLQQTIELLTEEIVQFKAKSAEKAADKGRAAEGDHSPSESESLPD